jgi:hypothetical protein
MANTYTDYTSGAGQTDFAINFDYLEDYHVIVNIDGTDYDVNSSGGSFTFTISTSPTKKVVISPPLSAGQKVRVYRNTRGINNDQVGRLVDFSDGSVIKADDLDTTYLHNLYLAQEASEDPISTVNAEDGAILTWSEDNGRWEVSGTGAVANAVLAYNSSTKKWDVIPLNLQYDSGNATFGFGGAPATTYKHKFYGDLLIRDDDNAVNGAVLTIENASTSGVTNAVLILASQSPILQFFDTNGSTDNKYFNVRLVNGELKFIPLDDGGAEKDVALKIATNGDGVTVGGTNATLEVIADGAGATDTAQVNIEGSIAVLRLYDTQATADKGLWQLVNNGDALALSLYTDAGSLSKKAIQLTADGYNVYGDGVIEDAAYKHTFHGDVLMHDTDAGSECVLKIQTEGTDAADYAAIILEGTSSTIVFVDTDAPTDKGRVHTGLDGGYLNFAVYNNDGSTLYGIPLQIGTGSNPAAANNNSGEKHNILLGNLPTSDPGVTHAIWNRNGTVAMSGSSRYIYDSGWVTAWGGSSIGSNLSLTEILSTDVASYFPFDVTIWFRSSSSATECFKISCAPDGSSVSTSVGVQATFDTSTRGLKLIFQDNPYYYELGSGIGTTATWNTGTGQIRVTIQ